MDIPKVLARFAKVPAADVPVLELELAASRSLLYGRDRVEDTGAVYSDVVRLRVNRTLDIPSVAE